MSYFSLGGGNSGGQSEEDGDFLGSSGVPNSSKLSSLFGLNQKITNAPDSNQSLQYIAPQPPGSSPVTAKKKVTKSTSGVLFATAVTAYIYVNKENKLHGKVGAAILKNTETKDFQILIYVTKQQPVTTCQITPAFNIAIQANNYVSFYDDKQQSWTMLFDSATNVQLFAKNISLSKYFSCKLTPTNSIIQDLNINSSKSDGVETGDSLEVKYTGWLVGDDCSLGEVFDSNVNNDKTFRFKSGKGKVIKGWESGMMGMMVGGKRFLVIPPQLAYGERSVGNKIPPNSTLAFEVDLLRLKQKRENVSIKSSSSVESLTQTGTGQVTQQNNTVSEQPVAQENPEFHHPTLDDLQSVKVRTNSMNQQLSGTPPNTGDGKGSLVLRMAKMGHSMLPGANVAQPNLEDSTINISNPETLPTDSQPLQNNQEVLLQQPVQQQLPTRQPAPTKSHAPSNQHINKQMPINQLLQYNQQINPQHFNQAINQQQPYAMSQSPNTSAPVQNYNQQTPMNQFGQQINQPPMSPYQSLHQQHHMGFREEQFQVQVSNNPYNPLHQMSQYPHSNMSGGYELNFLPMLVTESKQHNSQLKSLDGKVDKISDSIEHIKKSTDANHLDPKQHMDTSIIIHNIQRIVQENERLKQQVLDKSKQIENQNDKIGNLLQQNQRHVEKSNLILEQRNDSYKESFDQSRARNLELESEIREITQRLNESGSKVTELKLEAEGVKDREQELKQKFKGIYMAEKEKTAKAEETIKELEEKLQIFEEKLALLVKSEPVLKTEKQKLELQLQEVENDITLLREGHTNEITSLLKEKSGLENMIDELKHTHLNEIKLFKHENQETVSLKLEFAKLKSELDLESESKSEAEEKITAMQKRFSQVRSLFEEQKLKLQSAVEELEEISPYKEAYEKLRSQATVMKKKYEEKIIELQEGSKAQEVQLTVTSNVFDEIKKIMNVIFQRAKSQIQMEEQYEGGFVLRLLMAIIKKTTMELLNRKENEREMEEANGEINNEEEKGEMNNEQQPNETMQISEVENGVEKYENELREEGELEKGTSDEKTIENNNGNDETDESETNENKLDADFAIEATEKMLSETSHSNLNENREKCEDSTNKEIKEKNEESIEKKFNENDEVTDVEVVNEIVDYHKDGDSNKEVNGELQTEIDKPECDKTITEKVEENQSAVDPKCVGLQSINLSESEGNEKEPPLDADAVVIDEVTKQPEEDDDQIDAMVESTNNISLNDVITEQFDKVKMEKCEEVVKSTSRSSSVVSDSRQPPPLFDDDSDDSDLDWLN